MNQVFYSIYCFALILTSRLRCFCSLFGLLISELPLMLCLYFSYYEELAPQVRLFADIMEIHAAKIASVEAAFLQIS